MACDMHPFRLDLFCQVIDNYGDAGVCWRLARQLVDEYGLRVRLWIDKLAVLKKISPEVQVDFADQTVSGVRISYWTSSFPVIAADEIPDVVIEGFGTHLPESYVRQMADKPHAPVWINLEYLSAESWVEASHLMASPQSWIPLTKYFFFPGFTEKTGGLIREKGLIKAREVFQQDRDSVIRFLSSIGIVAHVEQFIVSLFCYPDAPIHSLLKAFAESGHDVLCLVPEGVASSVLESFMGKPAVAGTCFSAGQLQVQILPMIEQHLYDRLLWSCDFNFVRGEDSFIRAQWAGRPFVWHIYPQQEDAHLVKLDAFLKCYLSACTKENASLVKRFWYSWNNADEKEINRESWIQLREIWQELNQHGHDWSKKLSTFPDLAANLVRFIKKLRKTMPL